MVQCNIFLLDRNTIRIIVVVKANRIQVGGL